jgi:hypothetical protein
VASCSSLTRCSVHGTTCDSRGKVRCVLRRCNYWRADDADHGMLRAVGELLILAVMVDGYSAHDWLGRDCMVKTKRVTCVAC